MRREAAIARQLVGKVGGGPQCEILGLNQREMTVVDPGARHQTTQRRGRIVRQVLQHRLLDQRRQPLVRNVRNDDVLSGREPDLAVAVRRRHARDVTKMCGGDPTGRGHQPDVVQPGLFLPDDPQMIGHPFRSRVPSGGQQRPGDPRLQLAAESLGAPVFDQKREPRLVARRPRSVVAEDERDLRTERRGPFGLDEDIERRRHPAAAGSDLAADGDVESVPLVAIDDGERRRQRQILRVRMRAVLGAAGDADVELARQVGECLVPQQQIGELPGDRRRIEELAIGRGRRRRNR